MQVCKFYERRCKSLNSDSLHPQAIISHTFSQMKTPLKAGSRWYVLRCAFKIHTAFIVLLHNFPYVFAVVISLSFALCSYNQG